MFYESSLQPQISRVADRYSSLFTLPSQRKIFTYLFALCLVGGSVTFISRISYFFNLVFGLLVGVFLFLTTLFAEYLNSKVFLRADPIFDLRRCSFLSVPSCLVLYIFTSAANLIGLFNVNSNLWTKIVSAGFFAALTFRLFVFSTVSSVNYSKVFCSASSQPALILIVLSMSSIRGYRFDIYSIFPLLVSMFLAIFGIYIFVSSVDAAGEGISGIRPLPLFRAFLANWTENLNEPLESFFEKLGEEREIEISLLAFKTKGGLKALIVVPVIHPGPFRNVGSSPLPHLIQETLERKLNCTVSVPHGISGHNLDLASQLQNEKVLSRIVDLTEFEDFDVHATPLVRSKSNSASASCQIFGDCALFTLTLAPETMEDLPKELDYAITHEVKKKGLAMTINIDAHNSIQGPFNPERAAEPLRKAAVNALEKALACKRYPLEVGAAKINPKEFSIQDGVGPGGIITVIMKVGSQKTAYVTIDGNNMMSGLREKTLLRLKALGITGGEVLTTDTHVVNGVVRVARGYYPLGEAIDQKKLIGYIEEAASSALRNLEPAEFSWRAGSIPNVKIIGERQLNDLCLLTDETVKRVKKVAMLLFPSLAILLTAILIFI